MSERLIVVDGQDKSVARHGGAARYGLELFRRFAAGQASSRLPGVSIRLVRFPPLEPGPPTPDTRRRVKRGAQRYLPPVVYEGLRQAYRLVRPGPRKAAEAGPPAARPAPALLHELGNHKAGPEVGRWSLVPGFRLCVTFLDIQDVFYPEYFDDDQLLRYRLHYALYRERADWFFAISEFTKATMVERLGVPAERITVTHPGVDDRGLVTVGPEARAWAQRLGRYLLYPAKSWRHKNHEFLIRVLGLRRDELARAGIKVVLTGGFVAPGDAERLRMLCAEHRVAGSVEILGFQTEERMQALLSHAEFLVFPSLFEGFGLPVLEAMSSGCPVVCSDRASLPEIAGDAATYFDPADEDSLVGVLDGIVAGKIDRDDAIRRGRARAGRFTWDETFARTVEQYRALL
jgi:glycosyltransferase involved in cell wall biosynthesis